MGYSLRGCKESDTTEQLNNNSAKESGQDCIPLTKILLKRLKEN